MKNSQVLFISQPGGDTHVWTYGLGKQGIHTVTTTSENIRARTSVLEGCTLIVLDLGIDELDINKSRTELISICHDLRTAFGGPILVFTYEHDERIQLQLYQAGIDECITKPIGIPLALAKVMSWLRQDSALDSKHSIEQQPFEQ